MSLIEFFTKDHRECDARWAEVEAAIDGGDEGAAKAGFATFDAAMRRHLGMEEEVLFPTFEAATGMQGGPTQVMRMEHEQMRGVLGQMARLVETGELDRVVDLGDTLLMLIQQHNAKEEGILYPMASQVLAAEWSGLEPKLASYQG